MTLQTRTLKNGLRIVTDRMDTVETASIGCWVDVGTRNESPDVNGVSHLLEHMAFKGTRRRSAQAIAEEIEAVGGHLNAYTSRENTAYYAKVLKEDVGLAMDIIGDILQHSTLDDAELKRERAVVLQEIHQANDTPEDVIFDRFQAVAFPDQAIGRPVLGEADLVGSMPRETLLGYMKRHYASSRIVLSAAGHVDHDEIVRLAEKTFTELPSEPADVFEPLNYIGGDERKSKELEQVQLVMGFEGMSYDDPDFYAAAIFSALFGGGMSSRLFQEIREKRGLVYSVYSFNSCYTDGGVFGIYAGTGREETAELLPVLCDEIVKIRQDVTEEEIQRARSQIKASILMSLESTASRCEQHARQLLVFGRTLSTEEVVEKVEVVDREAVLRVARRLTSGKPTLTALGPVEKVPSSDELAAKLN